MVLLGLCVTSGLRSSELLFGVSVAMLLGSIAYCLLLSGSIRVARLTLLDELLHFCTHPRPKHALSGSSKVSIYAYVGTV